MPFALGKVFQVRVVNAPVRGMKLLAHWAELSVEAWYVACADEKLGMPTMNLIEFWGTLLFHCNCEVFPT
jgi:hypothetical protein